MNISDQSIGSVFRELREQRRLTREELAGKLRTNKATITRMENCSEDFCISTLRRCANALGKKINLEIR